MLNGTDLGRDLLPFLLIRDGLCAFLESIEDRKVETIARELGSTLSREFILFVFKKIILETYLLHPLLLCGYGGFAHLEVDNEGRDYTITLLHTLGLKRSRIVK